MAHLPRRTAPLALALAYACQLTACTSWYPRTGPTPEVVAHDGERPMRVTLSDGSRTSFDKVRLDADSLVGLSIRGTDTTEQRIPRHRITAIEVRKTNAAATAALVAGGVGLVVVGGSLIALSTWDGTMGSPSY